MLLQCNGGNNCIPIRKWIRCWYTQKFSYKTDLDLKIASKDNYSNLNSNFYYQLYKDGRIEVYPYKLSAQDSTLLDDAEAYFATTLDRPTSSRFNKVRAKYELVLKSYPNFSPPRVYIGQTYGMEGVEDEAIEWYLEAIDMNYIDYKAHWFLAEAYVNQGLYDRAVHEISVAFVLNRNHPEIEEALKRIYKSAKLKHSNLGIYTRVPHRLARR